MQNNEKREKQGIIKPTFTGRLKYDISSTDSGVTKIKCSAAIEAGRVDFMQMKAIY